MTAGERMVRDFECIHPDATAEEAIRRLKSAEADPIPVCDGDRLIGMVSYKEVAAGIAAGVRRGSAVRARDLVAPDLIYCRESTELEEAVTLMRENDVRVVPVLNAAGRIVGILRQAALDPVGGGGGGLKDNDPTELAL